MTQEKNQKKRERQDRVQNKDHREEFYQKVQEPKDKPTTLDRAVINKQVKY